MYKVHICLTSTEVHLYYALETYSIFVLVNIINSNNSTITDYRKKGHYCSIITKM